MKAFDGPRGLRSRLSDLQCLCLVVICKNLNIGKTTEELMCGRSNRCR